MTADARLLKLLPAAPTPGPGIDLNGLLGDAIADLDPMALERDYWRHEELMIQPHWVPESIVSAMRAEVDALRGRVVRKRVGSYKVSGSISYYTVRALAPTIMALYNSPRFIAFLSELSGQPLLTCPDNDPHAAAIYCYDQPADRVGFHYDKSWYRGARYTVLIGLEDDSDARLRCRVYMGDPFRETKDLDVATRPGTLVFFNGDKLYHGVTPLGDDQTRIVLTLQYVTDRRMTPLKRAISAAKDALTYFGAEAIFGPKTPKTLPEDPVG